VNLLLDTHSFIWFVEDNPSLSSYARMLIEEPTNDVFLSIVSVWVMAIKVSLGKLVLSQPFDLFISNQLLLNNITWRKNPCKPIVSKHMSNTMVN
jgi:PIN domain nuclease of toxin-antitoxin system